jgi:DNA (cytosine-5)-methyltransferase 1
LTLTGELAVNINPKVLIVENVPGVLAGEHAKYWEKLNKIMRDAGYQTHTLRCQSSDLGIPQMRKRVLFFAWRTAHTNPVFDIPQNTHLSLKEVLHSLKGVPNHKPKRLIPNTKDWLIAKRIKPGQKLSNVRGGENSVPTWDIPEVFGNITQDERTILELVRKMRRQDRKRTNGDADPVSFQRLTSALGVPFINHVGQLLEKGYLRRIGEDVDLVGTFNGKYRRLNEHSPSCTVDTRFGSPRYFLHPTYDRGFTVREAARIQGFGDNYIFQGSEQTQYRVIGNAVPPVIGRFAAQVAKQLMST